MNVLKRSVFAVVFLYCFSSIAGAQNFGKDASGGRTGQPLADSLPAGALAVVIERVITSADIDPRIQQMLAGINAELDNARQNVLDNQINSILMEAAAKKRNMHGWDLYDLEVTKRVSQPTDQDAQAFYDANRAQFGTLTIDNARAQIIAYLKNQQVQKLSSEFYARLRASNPISINTVNQSAAQFAPGTVVASAAGQSITAGSLAERLKPVLYKLRLNSYQVQKAGVDKAIDDILLIAEAGRRNIGPEEIIRAEITDKLHPPSEAEITRYFNENKAHITGTLESHRAEIIAYLAQQEQVKLERALSNRLRTGAQIRVLLKEPEPPTLSITTAGSASRGDANAPVTIVEFTDFECPACGKMYPVIEDTLKPYGNRVHFVIRNFPLEQHVFARKAAEAAMEAKAQGKFFEYIALLFTNQQALDVPSLKKYATAIGLDRGRFDVALDSGAHAGEVQRDLEDGRNYGVDGTPTLFVNGVRIRELGDVALKGAIDHALTNPGQLSQTPARTAQ